MTTGGALEVRPNIGSESPAVTGGLTAAWEGPTGFATVVGAASGTAAKVSYYIHTYTNLSQTYL
jgi:hypothetical protein